MQNRKSLVRARRVSAIYAVAALVWIIVTTRIAARTFPDTAAFALAEIVKDCFFAAATTILFFLLFRRETRISQEATAELRRNEKLLRSVTDCSDDMIFVKDRDGRVVFMNPAGYRMSGLTPEQVIGRTTAESHIDAAEAAQFMVDDRRVMESGRTETIEEGITTPDGPRRVCLTTKAPRIDEEGRVIGLVGISHEITERKQAEQALLREKMLVCTLMDNLPDRIYFKDSSSRYTCVNPAMARSFGLADPADAIGKSDLDFYAERHAAKALADERAVMQTGHPMLDIEELEIRCDGRETWALTSKLALRDTAGHIIGTCGISSDITERKRAEERLRESEEMYRSLFNNMLNGFAYCRMIHEEGRPADFVYLKVNSAFVSLTGLNDVEGRRVSEVIPGICESDAEIFRIYGRVAATGIPERFEYYVVALKEWNWISVYSPEKDHFVAVFDVITARKRAEERLRASEERYRLLAENAEDFVALNDTQGHRLYVSPSYHRVTGWKPEEDGTADWSTHVHADDLPVVRRAREANLAGETTTIEYRIRCSNESWIWVEAQCKPVRGQDGDIEHLLVWSHDITRRKQAEEGLIRLATVVEQAAESILITDTRGIIQYVNPAFVRTSGHGSAEVIGRNPRILKSGKQDAGFYKEMWAALARGDVWTGHLSNKRKDGSLYEEEATISPVRNAAGRIVNYVAIKRDVTEQVILQQQLLQAQKMETIGQLAGGVAHDFNNLLQAILGYNEIILAGTPPDDAHRSDLLEIQKTGRRAADLTRQLLALGRKQNLDRRVTDINALIEDFSKMLRRVIGESIRVEFELAPGPDRVLVDHGQIGQILLNLAVNARDAMPRGGRILFKTDVSDFQAGDLAAQPDVLAGRFVCVSVSDTGTGMPPEVLEKLFEPFFTTKSPGKGTGLGLATSYGIARQHGGWMDVYSEVDNGSSFKLFLPVIETVSEPMAIKRQEPSPGAEVFKGAGQRILFVEDEDVIRTMVQRQLQRNGYQVTAMPDATAAQEEFERAGGQFDLVLTDVVLPDLNGIEMLQSLCAKKPGLRVLISSGYTDNEKRWPVILERGWPFIGKPYTSGELFSALHKQLGPA